MQTKIGFTGDIAFSEYTEKLYKTPEKIDKRIYEFLNSNDYNILNFESPITTMSYTTKGALAHRSDIESFYFIKENIKNPVLSLANNHMMDYGVRGITDTFKILEKEKVRYIGAGKNLKDATKSFILGNKVKIGVLSFQYKSDVMATNTDPGTAHEKHFKTIKNKIKELKKETDWVVLVYHGGEEFSNSPMPYTKKKIKRFLNAGADIIVAHHPHTVQGYEKIKNKLVFYSLGNFIFDTDFQRAQKGTDRGVIVSITFKKDSYEFETMLIKNDRKHNKITVASSDENFKDIKNTWKKDWKKEAARLDQIKENKKELKEYRRMFIINDLRIEKKKIDKLVTFDKLVKNNDFEGINEPVIFESKGIIIPRIRRLFKKIKNANYSRRFYMLRAKLFRW